MKHLKIQHVHDLEESISFCSNPYPRLLSNWELLNNDGTKHEDNDKLINAMNQIHESKKTIEKILNVQILNSQQR